MTRLPCVASRVSCLVSFVCVARCLVLCPVFCVLSRLPCVVCCVRCAVCCLLWCLLACVLCLVHCGLYVVSCVSCVVYCGLYLVRLSLSLSTIDSRFASQLQRYAYSYSVAIFIKHSKSPVLRNLLFCHINNTNFLV